MKCQRPELWNGQGGGIPILKHLLVLIWLIKNLLLFLM